MDSIMANAFSGLNQEQNPAGAAHHQPNVDDEAGAGKDLPPARSRVVHIRNIPSEATEAEIINLGARFGGITKVLVLKGKNQALLEFQDENSAGLMVDRFTACVEMLRGRTVYVQFSNHQQLRTAEPNFNSAFRAGLQINSKEGGLHMADASALEGLSTVIRVVLENMIYPVTLDVLHQIFGRVGRVLRIITFTKNNTYQALIQFSDVDTALAAKINFDGQNVYNGCCTLRVEFSKLSTLNVRYNNDKSRDFTNPLLPTGDPMENMAIGLGLAGAAPTSSLSSTALGNWPATFGTADGGCLGRVVLVSNLNADRVTPDALFTLFGIYGDVLRVKILYNKKDTALVQMSEPLQAHLAIVHLDRVQIWGHPIRVLPSKHQAVQMPKEDQADAAELTKDYSDSTLHRFRRFGPKRYQNICPPSNTLHLSNIPSSADNEDAIKEVFAAAGFTVRNFKFFPQDHRMALIELASTDEAVQALIKMHNHRIGEGGNLRVSFTSSVIKPA